MYSIISLLIFQFAMAGDISTLSAVCEKLEPKCDANELMAKMKSREKLDEYSVAEKIEKVFYRKQSTTTKDRTIWTMVLNDDQLRLPKQLIKGGANPEEAVFLSTFYKDFDKSTLDKLPVTPDQLRLFRFQFKTKRNKTDCMGDKLILAKNNICESVKLCSISCEELDKPVFEINKDSASQIKEPKGSR